LGELGGELERLSSGVVTDDVPLVNHRFGGVRPGHEGSHRHWMGSYYPPHDDAGPIVAVGALVSDDQSRRRPKRRATFAAVTSPPTPPSAVVLPNDQLHDP
jgi:hypothetical protein